MGRSWIRGAVTTGLPPSDKAAEEAVVAACLLDDTAVARARAIVEPEDFFHDHLRWMYEACVAVTDRGEEATTVNVAHELEGKKGKLGTEDWESWNMELVELAAKYFTAAGVETHARIVARDAVYRNAIQAAGKIAELAYVGGPDPDAVLAEGQSILLALRRKNAENDPEAMGWHKVFSDNEGYMSEIPVIDRNLRGVQKGDLITIAGPSGMGKSMLAQGIAVNTARNGAIVMAASMEMDATEIEERMVRQIAQLDRRPQTVGDWHMIYDAQSELDRLPIKVWYKPRLTVEQLTARATVMKADSGLDILIVDYLQLMSLPNTRETEASKLGYVTSSLKNLATEMGIAVILLSQMNRGAAAEMRGRDAVKRECIVTGNGYAAPYIESLKGSGSIEQDSDAVLILTRHPDCVPGRHLSLSLAKNRGGEIGECLLVEEYARSTFRRMTEEEIYALAKGNTYMTKMLRIDQGHNAHADYIQEPSNADD